MTRTCHIHHVAGRHITRSMRTHLGSQPEPSEAQGGTDLRELAHELGLPHGTLHDEILRALGRILRRVKTIRVVSHGKTIRIVSIATDNGSEFLDYEAIEALFRRHGAPKVYCTHAHAAGEKGSVENANRLVRRWYPKGTDFSKVSARHIAQLEETIHSIHRRILDGRTAREACDQVAA